VKDAVLPMNRLTFLLTALVLHGLSLAMLLGGEPKPVARHQAVEVMVRLIAASTSSGSQSQRRPVVSPTKVTKPQSQRQVVQTPTQALPPVALVSQAMSSTLTDNVTAEVALPGAARQSDLRADEEAMSPPRLNAAYLNNPAPLYPPLSRRMGEEGKVVLRVLVNAEGAAIQVNLHTTSGSTRLDDAATKAVQLWRFVPAQQADKAVMAWVLVPIRFRLDS